jgi:hypothetical protein
MAKKKRKTNTLLPKRIAGVKLPKAVRKGRLAELLASKTGQALLMDALLAASALAGAKKAGDSPSARSFLHDTAEHVRARGDGKVALAPAGGALAYALGEAARAFAEALRTGAPQAAGATQPEPEADWDPAPHDGSDEAQKKRQENYEAGPL